MKSYRTRDFKKLFDKLPEKSKSQARETYRRFKKDPYHPSLHFKRVHSKKPVYSVRISIDYRALGVIEQNNIIWFWIGNHGEYDKLL